jgi:hypothetical protein
VHTLQKLHRGFLIPVLALVALLLWPGVSNATSGWYAEYFPNRHLTGAPAVVRHDEKIDFNWGAGSPDPLIPVDNFSARWTQTLHLEEGRYEFSVAADDGVRLFVDGRLIIDDWRNTAFTTRTATIDLGAGARTVRLEYYEATGNAAVRLTWERKPIPRPIGNIVTWLDHGTWAQIYRLAPDGTWQRMNPGGTGPINGGGRVKIDGLEVDRAYGDKGQPYRVEIWEQGRMLRSVGNIHAGQPEWRLYPYRDNVTPWGPGVAAPAPAPTPKPVTEPVTVVKPTTGTVVNAHSLNVRRGPGVSNPVVTAVRRGQTVELTGFRNASGTWVQIRAHGVTGWVNAYYIQSHVPVHSLAIAR